MRTVLSLIIIFSTSFYSLAQSRNNAEALKLEADQYFQEEQYSLAIQYYQELVQLSDKDAEVNFQLAESYRKIFNYKAAEVYYLKVHKQTPLQFPLSLYYYSLMLKLNGRFDDSIINFTKFIEANLQNDTFKEYLEQAYVDRAGSEMARTEYVQNNNLYFLKSETINTSYNDYAPALIDSTTLVITSGRLANNREAIDERYGEAFTDNFYFTKSGEVWQNKTRLLFNNTNSRYNDGSGSFNGKGDKYYFTVCGKNGPQCHIFLSVLKNDKWLAPTALNDNINYKNFETKHPAMSKGGDTLLFASNRPGGFGKNDIWMSINAGNEHWGPAVNLGSSINTKLDELAPAFTGYSNFFFMASDGHQNYGGLDLYMVKWLTNGSTALFNLDYPFNSNRDDCFIALAEKKIYFSSNREGGVGSFDIYSVPIPSVISFASKLSLKNKDARGDVKLNARTESISNINLLTARNEDRIEYENLTYEKRKIADRMIYNKLRSIKDDRLDYSGLSEEEYALLKSISETQFKTLEIERRFSNTLLKVIKTTGTSIYPFSITGVLSDSTSQEYSANRKILLMDDLGEVLKVTTTNESGHFRFTNVESSKNLYLRLEEVSNDALKKSIITDLSIVKTEFEGSQRIENIYFDFDQYLLRPEARQVLDELAIYLIRFPKVQVEMYAYADDLGTDDYNMVLSQKRGSAVLAYLTDHGVDQTSLAIVAKGKQNLPSSEVEIQRQVNRRVEFSLNGSQAGIDMKVKTYILKKKSDWKALSASTGVSKEELRKLNNADSSELQLFQPVRIPTYATKISEELFYEIH